MLISASQRPVEQLQMDHHIPTPSERVVNASGTPSSSRSVAFDYTTPMSVRARRALAACNSAGTARVKRLSPHTDPAPVRSLQARSILGVIDENASPAKRSKSSVDVVPCSLFKVVQPNATMTATPPTTRTRARASSISTPATAAATAQSTPAAAELAIPAPSTPEANRIVDNAIAALSTVPRSGGNFKCQHTCCKYSASSNRQPFSKFKRHLHKAGDHANSCTAACPMYVSKLRQLYAERALNFVEST